MNHRLLYVLAPVSLIIWVMIIHKLVWQVNDFHTTTVPPRSDSISFEKMSPPEQNYDSLFSDLTGLRNPFQADIPTPRHRVLSTFKKDSLSTVRFVGFITDGKTPLAVLELSAAKTVISREGQLIGDWRVMSIDPAKISLRYKNSVYVFRLNQ